LTGSFLNALGTIVHDCGELQMHLLRQSEYVWASRDSRMPRTPGAFPAQAKHPDGHKDADVRRSVLGKDKPNVDTSIFALRPGVMPPRSALIRQCLSVGRSTQHVCTPNAPPCVAAQGAANLNWPRDVTISTLDSESGDRNSNPRQAFCQYRGRPHLTEPLHDARRSSADPSA
jgi:hypothetical protein